MLTKIDKAITAGVSAGVLAFLSAHAGGAGTETSAIAALGGFIVGALTYFIPNKAA